MDLIPLKYRVLRVLAGRRQTYQEVSDKNWILQPGEHRSAARAIYLDGELDKVTHVSEHTSHELEWSRVLGERTEKAATIAYSLRNASLLHGYVYKGGMKNTLVATKEPIVGLDETQYMPQAALACTYCGNRFFGHFLRDDFPLTLAAQQLATAITTVRKAYQHEYEYRQLLDIKPNEFKQVRCGELIIIDDIAFNRFKRQRLETIRSRLKKALQPIHSSHGVMLRRGASGTSRVMTNENEVEKFLETRGFTIIDPTRMSAIEILRRALGAKIVIGNEGSQMNHGMLAMADHGAVFTLQPPYRFNNIFKEYTDCLDMKYAFVVGQKVEGGFKIKIEDLARTMDKVETLF